MRCLRMKERSRNPIDSTARSGRLRCNGWVRENETVNQIAAPDRTDLSVHRSLWQINTSANGSLAGNRLFSVVCRHVGIDRSKLLMEAVAADRQSR